MFDLLVVLVPMFVWFLPGVRASEKYREKRLIEALTNPNLRAAIGSSRPPRIIRQEVFALVFVLCGPVALFYLWASDAG